MKDVERLAEQIVEEHNYRLNRPDEVPIVRNPFRHRARPKTAIIAEAAQELALKRRRGSD